MIRSMVNKYFLLLICLSVAACSGTKLLPKGEKLYTGAKIKLVQKDKSLTHRDRGLRVIGERIPASFTQYQLFWHASKIVDLYVSR